MREPLRKGVERFIIRGFRIYRLGSRELGISVIASALASASLKLSLRPELRPKTLLRPSRECRDVQEDLNSFLARTHLATCCVQLLVKGGQRSSYASYCRESRPTPSNPEETVPLCSWVPVQLCCLPSSSMS